MSFSITNKESMIKLGGAIYDRVALGLRTTGGALEVSAEIIGDLAKLAMLLSRNLRLYKLDILHCKGSEARIVVSLCTLKRALSSLEIFQKSKLQLSSLDEEESEVIVMELWTIKALIGEAIGTIADYLDN